MRDPIFKDANAIAGPKSIFAFELVATGKWVYIIGEDHEAGGNSLPGAVRVEEAIVNYARYHDLTLCLETTADSVIEIAGYLNANMVPASPINAVAGAIYEASDTVLGHINLVNAEIRKSPPYSMLSILTDHIGFASEYLNIYDTSAFITRRAAVKLLEKNLLKAMKTRTSAKNFLKSLVLPDIDVPQWYLHAVAELGVDAPFVLKRDLAHIRDSNFEFYRQILSHIDIAYDSIVNIGSFHSKAIESIERQRRTTSRNFAMKHLHSSRRDDIETHFIRLCGVWFDIRVIIELYMYYNSNKDSNNPFVVIAGDAHARMLANFIVTNLHTKPEHAWSNTTLNPDIIPVKR
jgi:hypothetical protein